MDIMLSIVQLYQNDYLKYKSAIEQCNLPKEIKWELDDLMKTALEQTRQAKNMGWL